jgi:hypothetical protein
MRVRNWICLGLIAATTIISGYAALDLINAKKERAGATIDAKIDDARITVSQVKVMRNLQSTTTQRVQEYIDDNLEPLDGYQGDPRVDLSVCALEAERAMAWEVDHVQPIGHKDLPPGFRKKIRKATGDELTSYITELEGVLDNCGDLFVTNSSFCPYQASLFSSLSRAHNQRLVSDSSVSADITDSMSYNLRAHKQSVACEGLKKLR